MSEAPDRGALVDYLFREVNEVFLEMPDVPPTQPRPVLGDHVAAPKSGWSEGQPGAQGSYFVPHAVLKLRAGQVYQRQGVTDPALNWVFGLVFSVHGAARGQTDWLAGIVSDAVMNIGRVGASPNQGAPAGAFGIVTVTLQQVGATEVNEQVSPPLWTREDIFNIVLSRGRDRNRQGR